MSDDELFQMALDILDGKRWLGDWNEWESMVRERMKPNHETTEPGDALGLDNLSYGL